MENFLRLLKIELFYLQMFQSMEQFKQKFVAYLAYYDIEQIKPGWPPFCRLLRGNALYRLNTLDLPGILGVRQR